MMACTRRATNTNDRGSSYDRRRRRRWLRMKHGMGRMVVCFHCGRAVFTWEVDRWPLCGHRGGRYTRDNIVAACRPCNAARGVACSQGRCEEVSA